MCPARLIVLLYEKSADAFVEVPMLHEALAHPVLHLQDIMDGHRSPAADLLEDDSEG